MIIRIDLLIIDIRWSTSCIYTALGWEHSSLRSSFCIIVSAMMKSKKHRHAPHHPPNFSDQNDNQLHLSTLSHQKYYLS